MAKFGTTVKLVLREGGRDGKGKRGPEEKQKIVLAGLRNGALVVELYRRHGVSDVMYYKWGKALLEGALNVLKGNGTASSTEATLRRENEELKALIGELAVQNCFLKRI